MSKCHCCNPSDYILSKHFKSLLNESFMDSPPEGNGSGKVVNSKICPLQYLYDQNLRIMGHFTLARILSRARAEPLVWTPCSKTVFTLEAQLKLSSGSAQDFLNRAPSWASLKCPSDWLHEHWYPPSFISAYYSTPLTPRRCNILVYPCLGSRTSC